MPVLPGDIPDVVKAYLADVAPQKYVDVVRDRQRSTFAMDFVNNSIVPKVKKKAVEYRVEFMISGYNNTRAKSIDSPDAPNRGNVYQYGLTSMTFQDTHFIVNKLEPSFTSGSKQEVVNYLDMHLVNMYDRWFEFNDNKLFSLPTYPNTTDPLYWSIPYYVCPSSTAAFGFNGHTNGSYTSVLGLDRTTSANAGLRNGTGRYTHVTQLDFCKLAAEAFQKCNFSPYYNVGTARAKEDVASHRFKFYSDFDTIQAYQDIAYSSNDNIGSDQGKYRGGRDGGPTVFLGVDWSWVPARLENGAEVATIDAGYFYGLDLSTWEMNTYGDWFMKFERDAIRLEDSHNMLVSWMDSAFQMVCKNPRQNFVLTT